MKPPSRAVFRLVYLSITPPFLGTLDEVWLRPILELLAPGAAAPKMVDHSALISLPHLYSQMLFPLPSQGLPVSPFSYESPYRSRKSSGLKFFDFFLPGALLVVFFYFLHELPVR